MNDQDDYRRRHTGKESVATGYDRRLFTEGTYESMLWQRETKLLDEIVERWVPRRDAMLDFACGTGRVLAHLEDRFADPAGLDISPDMLANARPKMSKARLVCGDATRDPEVAGGPFDLVTSFRFFLNAQEALRNEAMAWLATRLRDERSVLFFNIHGNRFSSRQFSARIKKFQGKVINWMSRGEVERMVARHGLEVVDWHGLVYVDKFVYKHVPRFVWRAMERTFEILHAPKSIAVNLYFVCRKKA